MLLPKNSPGRVASLPLYRELSPNLRNMFGPASGLGWYENARIGSDGGPSGLAAPLDRPAHNLGLSPGAAEGAADSDAPPAPPRRHIGGPADSESEAEPGAGGSVPVRPRSPVRTYALSGAFSSPRGKFRRRLTGVRHTASPQANSDSLGVGGARRRRTERRRAGTRPLAVTVARAALTLTPRPRRAHMGPSSAAPRARSGPRHLHRAGP